MPEVSDVKVVVYDILGRDVATLVDGKKPPGNHAVQFDAASLASGVYLYRLQAGSYVQTRKMVWACKGFDKTWRTSGTAMGARLVVPVQS